MSARHLPLFAQLRGRACLVVGGGEVAARKVEALLQIGAAVTVVSPELVPALTLARDSQRITHVTRHFIAQDIGRHLLVIAATDSAAVNAAVAAAADEQGRLVNVVDQPALCSVIFPALVRRGELTIAVSTGGAAPVLARLVRARIEALLPQALGELVSLAARWRATLKARFPAPGARRRVWQRIFDERGAVMRALIAHRPGTAEAAMAGEIEAAAEFPRGLVSLVGAGPGDVELLTLRGLRALQCADYILHDRLISKEILGLARREAICIDVGKREGEDHGATQATINARLVELAQAGHHVVRLKGGDPFIFGRGGEELAALHALGIAYEVVPGITAALGCAAYAGIPLTHRELAQQVCVVTAHCARSLDRIDWSKLVSARQTLVFYMGVAQAQLIQERLLDAGMAHAMPLAIIEHGTLLTQRVIHTRLAKLAVTMRAQDVHAPALIIVGEVAALAAEWSWFGEDISRMPLVTAEALISS